MRVGDHNLTIASRNTYEFQAPGVRAPQRLRDINEIQHRVLAHILALSTVDVRRYPDDDLLSIVLEHGDEPLQAQSRWALGDALQRAGRWFQLKPARVKGMRQFLRFLSDLLGHRENRPRDLVPTGHVLDGDDPDEAVMNQLRASGSDLKKPTHVLFYLYAPTEAGAKRIADRGVDAALRAEVRPSGTGDGTWLCLLQGTFVPVAAVLRLYRARFEALATAEGGEYDGWEAAVTEQVQ